MKHRFLKYFVALILATGVVAVIYAKDVSLKETTLIKSPLDKDKLKYLPDVGDFRNYFIFQSIGDSTDIIIADLVGGEKIFSLIHDDGSDGKVDKVIEFFPDANKYTEPLRPSTKFFTTLAKVKSKIVDGSIFRENYSYKMASMGYLKQLIKRGRDVYKTGHGYTVRSYDPDNSTSVMSEFFFGKKLGRYDLVFSTNYYNIFRYRINPPIIFSVYCKNSKDPYVKEIVESLFKEVAK